jgi:hypothetical protein
MLNQHKKIFFDAAERYQCIIGLREPNELADKWIGKPMYTPKGEYIKAKTADNSGHRFGGLVVNPFVCPEAFKDPAKAKRKWSDFAVRTQISTSPGGWFYVDKDGLLREHGEAIHADFDLMYICKAGKSGELQFTTREESRALFRPVQTFINMQIGSPMIQHGPEFDWDEGIGAKEEEWILSFGPSRKFNQQMSYFHTSKEKMI